jgi:serine protease Do
MKHMRLALAVLICTAVAWPVTRTAAAAEPSSRQLRRTPIVDVFEKTKEAVVSISCSQYVSAPATPDDLFEHFFDFRSPLSGRQRKITAVGSGFVLHPDGYVVTNAHVVLKTKDQTVIFSDKKEYKASPVAIDVKNDLAVLKIDAGHPLPALHLGRSDDLMIGETVVAIGNPLGYEHTLTTGVVSAVNRRLRFSQDVEYTGLIQTDASINPGNSGGPLLNILGELIGINTAIRGDAQNIGFAIPVDALRRALPNMLSLERLKRVEVGMRVGGGSTVRVTEVKDNGPAQAARIEPGDRLLNMDGTPIRQDTDFYISLLSKGANDRIALQLERNGKTYATTLTLRAIPIPDGAKLAYEMFGMKIAPLPAEVAKALDLEQGGLVIMEVERSSPAARAGLTRGMIIVTLAGDFPRDLDHVGLLLENVRRGDQVAFRIWQVDGQSLLMYPPVSLRAR